MTFEVRLTAYERPELLRRAIDSLRAQTYPKWRAVVMDDSRSICVSEVVAAIGDKRVSYVRNAERLGAAANIDQCFAPDSRSGCTYACLLEDDNYWLPGFLGSLAATLGERPWDLVLANQRIDDERVGLRPLSETTRGDWFGKGGVVEPIDLKASLLLMEGLSNGGLVWRLGAGIDLRVGASVQEAGLHEACRSLLVDRPFLFIAEPYPVWTRMPKERSARICESNRVINRGMQSIRDTVIRMHGSDLVARARRIAQRTRLEANLVEALAYSGWPAMAGDWLRGHQVQAGRAALKGLALRIVQPDPCAAFIKSVNHSVSS